MENIKREEYIDDVIATTVGVEPEAMFYVLERMGSLTGTVEMSNHLELVPNDMNPDDVLESAIGIEPVAMHQLLKKMDAMIEHPERDPAFSIYVDVLVDSIETQLKEYFLTLSKAQLSADDWKLKSA